MASARTRLRLLLATGALAASLTATADWPAARGGNGRTSASDTGPDLPLAPAWSADTGHPAPAWASEARGSLWQKIGQPLVPRAADDQAPVPVLAGGLVLVGTTRDEVLALDRLTGRRRWSHLCEAPVRYAPAVAGDSVVVGSDDGQVRALDLATGRVRWTTRLAPGAPWISGNGRLISPHPIRTGLVIENDVVYATAGLFPIEGTFLAALGLADGRILWRQDLGNVSPQGYLAVAGPDLIVPAGRAAPRVYRRADGRFRRELPSSHGTLAVVSDGETFSGPGATGSLAVQSASAAKAVTYPGRHLAVTSRRSYLVNDRELVVLDRGHLQTHPGDIAGAMLWKHAVSNATALAVAGAHVFLAGPDGIEVLEDRTGRRAALLPVADPVLGLAADDRVLVASTSTGRILGFTPGNSPAATPPNDPGRGVPGTDVPDGFAEAVMRFASRRGWALWAPDSGGPDGADGMIGESELHWILAAPPGSGDAWRRHLAASGRLGTRASVVERGADGTLPVVDHLFNLVVGDGLTGAEARRLACPGPSGVLLRDGVVSMAPVDPTAGRWTHQYGDAANTCATTQALRGIPRLQWFGGHGPERMPDRHTRGHAPLAAAGLLVSVAENALIATDSRNGTVRWETSLPDSMRYAMPYDAGHVVLSDDGRRVWAAVDAELWELDGRDGAVSRRIPCPLPGNHLGWVARTGDALFGSACRPEAPRTVKQFELVDLDYRSERPLVLARAVFRVDPVSGRLLWIDRSAGAWIHATLAADDGRVYGVEAIGPKVRSDTTGRLPCADLMEAARVVCLDGTTGRRLWERPLDWPEARDILGLAVTGDRLLLSCARSVAKQAAYHLRCWRADDGTELWRSEGMNPIEDLYHGQQVKRPVVAGDKVSFESRLFRLDDGRPWNPPGAAEDWILRRPGHACGGMTGTADGLLFRADNPTFFRFADGTFTRLSPTRPGCWLNILPADGGVLIPEASASCICGYPLQTSMGFGFRPNPTP